MSLQWTIVATFLYVEMFICVLLMLPFISAMRWRKIFKSRLFNALASYGNLYFTIFIVILVILFLDGVRGVYKYASPVSAEDLRNNPAAETMLHMKLFREQRNFYIAGFALFLSLVIRRLVLLVTRQALLEAEVEAATKQAESATAAAKQFMEDSDNKANEEGEGSNIKKELEKLKVKNAELEKDLARNRSDHDAMKQQAQSTNREYDRLMKEHESLQKKLKQAEESTESKKTE